MQPSITFLRFDHDYRSLRYAKPQACLSLSVPQHLLDLLLNLANQEWLALHLVQANRIDKEVTTQQQPQLPAIEFGNQHLLESLEDVGNVFRHGVEIAEVRGGDFHPLALTALHR